MSLSTYNPRSIDRTARDRGLALISTTVVMTVAFSLAVSLISFMLTSRQAAVRFEAKINSLQEAEAGIQKALFCLNTDTGAPCGGTFGTGYVGESDHSFNGGEFTVTVTGTGDRRLITSTGSAMPGQKTTVMAEAVMATQPYTETHFDFALLVTDQVGLDNNAVVDNGPIHSAADVECGNNVDILSDVIVSKIGGRIYNCDIGGDAHADELNKVDAGGDCYWRTDFINTACGGTVYPDEPTPPPPALPTFDLDFWRSEALLGGTISGDYYPADGESLGPVVIDGKLILDNNVDVIMTGPIWVMDEFEMVNNATITLDPSFGEMSSVIFADHPTENLGRIKIDNNAQLNGSGQPGSYILMVSTMADDTAIEVKNNAAGAVFLALEGGVKIDNNASLVAVAGRKVFMKNNAEITYDPDSLPQGLTLQTAGGSGYWELIPGTWREI
ncbi:hypothetical protein AMJ57_05195 [Parcubacteria bacterium SG8_24]|nr:MAG: hypothetical protein AMJ57_05195 [Parcubacteria bacterium SG8_24]